MEGYKDKGQTYEKDLMDMQIKVDLTKPLEEIMRQSQIELAKSILVHIRDIPPPTEPVKCTPICPDSELADLSCYIVNEHNGRIFQKGKEHYETLMKLATDLQTFLDKAHSA